MKNRADIKNRVVSSIFVLALLWPMARARGQTTQAAPREFEVQQWVVFVLDASQNHLNPDGLVTSHLPDFVGTRRTQAAKEQHDQPFPIGVIRLIGSADSKVDVMLEHLEGNFLASWPRAESRTKQLLWRDRSLSNHLGTDALETVPPGHWFNLLRSGPSAYLLSDHGGAERFLLFDVEMPYVCPLQVRGGSDSSVEVADIAKTPLHHVMLYESDKGSWRQGDAGDLLPLKNTTTTQPATTQAAAPKTPETASASQPVVTRTLNVQHVRVINGTVVSINGPVFASGHFVDDAQPTVTTTSAPATQPTSMPPGSSQVKMAAVPTTQPAELAASWKPILLNSGLGDEDCQVILQIIAGSAFNSHRLTVVYQMDDAELDRLLPLEVVPQPKKTLRVGIVIVKNADPALGSDIDDLIAQLGDPVWAKREEAYKSLQQMGPLALPKLREAVNNKDAEIAWRAEKLVSQAH